MSFTGIERSPAHYPQRLSDANIAWPASHQPIDRHAIPRFKKNAVCNPLHGYKAHTLWNVPCIVDPYVYRIV